MKSTEPTNIFKLGVKATGQSAPAIICGKLREGDTLLCSRFIPFHRKVIN